MSAQTPYEQVRFIRDVIKDRTDKSQPTFFSVKLESFGNITPLVDKEQGALFYDTIIQYLMRYDLSALIVELYHGKSHNIKEPFQTFRILIKRSANVNLSGIEKKENLELTQSEIISPEKHFHTLATKEFDLLRLQYENDVLKKKNKKKKAYIKELEKELERSEKEKSGSMGNVALGSVASNALEKFARSDFGIGILKNVFGAKEEVLQGLINTGTEETQAEEAKSTATLIKKPADKQLSENDKIRYQLRKHIADFLEKSDDATLRLYYEIVLLIGGDVQLLQSIFMQLKKHRETVKQNSTRQPSNNNPDNEKVEGENHKEENEDDTS